MIERSKYREILTQIQILCQNGVIGSQKRDELIKIMTSTSSDSKDIFLSEIKLIRRECQGYLLTTCEKICKIVKGEENEFFVG